MAGGHPHLGIHQNGAIQPHIVGRLLDEMLPPGFFYIVFQFHAQGAVVPGVGKSAVDLAAGIDKAPAFAQRDDLIHGLFGIFHWQVLLFEKDAYTGCVWIFSQQVLYRKKKKKKRGKPGIDTG